MLVGAGSVDEVRETTCGLGEVEELTQCTGDWRRTSKRRKSGLGVQNGLFFACRTGGNGRRNA
ncbi:hypothetical protein AG1IA_09467 [Rhizoctonia solani AG-1 IA]|uniref:Uncharacterized protein n=1 Tax=Thanatephorus cucumeris (strain AG1-IA) TaxID=983506 RepID=L8WE89_THACA|nr:hypothetical protein AG1IA_09467 [Rhizoctonia solani AG-1 IA]